MFKFYMALIIIASPFVSADNIALDKKKSVEGESAEIFKQTCKNVSGVDIDVERNERLYKEYEKCIRDKLDIEQFYEDLAAIDDFADSAVKSNSSLSEEEISFILAAVEKYCPNMRFLTTCEDTLSPIYIECFSIEEIRYNKFYAEVELRAYDFFCENDAERAKIFINEKFLDCLNFKQSDIGKCTSELSSETDEFLWPEESELCKSFEIYKNCFLPELDECKLSPKVLKLFESMFTYVQPETCANLVR